MINRNTNDLYTQLHQIIHLPFLILILLMIPQDIQAQDVDTVTYDAINDVAKELFCPVCESEPLDTCATQACQDWRDEIARQLANGRTKNQIHDAFRQRYGIRVLANPPVEGFNLILWLTIPIALLIGLFFFLRYIRQLHIPIIQSQSPVSNDLASHLQRIEDEVRK